MLTRVKPRDCHERTGYNASTMRPPATPTPPPCVTIPPDALTTVKMTGICKPSITISEPTWLVSIVGVSKLPSSCSNSLGLRTYADRIALCESKLDRLLFPGVYNLSARYASRERPPTSRSTVHNLDQALSSCSALSCLATTSSESFPSRLCDRCCTASTSSANLLFAWLVLQTGKSHSKM
jgi:hypothetical protein